MYVSAVRFVPARLRNNGFGLMGLGGLLVYRDKFSGRTQTYGAFFGFYMKRFTDTDTWDKEWFMDLSPTEKTAWYYIKDKCDNVGVWNPNYRLADYVIGATIDWNAFRDKCNGNIQTLDSGKWFISDFCEFQYGELKEECRPHQSYLRLLSSHGLRVSEGYVKGIYTHKDKDKDKDKEKDKDRAKEKNKYGEFGNVSLSSAEYDKCVSAHGEVDTLQAIDILANYKKSKGKTYKSDYAAMNNWVWDRVTNSTQSTRRELSFSDMVFTGEFCPKHNREIVDGKCPMCEEEKIDR